MENQNKLLEMLGILEFGLNPNTWGDDVINVKRIYNSLDDHIQKQKVMIDYVEPDKDSPGEYNDIREKHSLQDFIAELKEDMGGRCAMRGGIAVYTQCWWGGTISQILEGLIQTNEESKSGGKRTIRTKKRRKRAPRGRGKRRTRQSRKTRQSRRTRQMRRSARKTGRAKRSSKRK